MNISDATTLEQLRQLPLSEVIAALNPTPEYVVGRREGPFGGVYFRPMVFPRAGSKVVGHKHKYDHVTNIISGSVLVKFISPNGNAGEFVYKAPAKITILADVIHEFTALEDNTYAECIYPLRDVDTGKVVSHWDGGWEAYS